MGIEKIRLGPKSRYAEALAAPKTYGKPPGQQALEDAAKAAHLEDLLSLGDVDDAEPVFQRDDGPGPVLVDGKAGDPLKGRRLPPELAGCGCGRYAVQRDRAGFIVGGIRHRYGLTCLEVATGKLPPLPAEVTPEQIARALVVLATALTGVGFLPRRPPTAEEEAALAVAASLEARHVAR